MTGGVALGGWFGLLSRQETRNAASWLREQRYVIIRELQDVYVHVCGQERLKKLL
jgi:hypothetical protein